MEKKDWGEEEREGNGYDEEAPADALGRVVDQAVHPELNAQVLPAFLGM